MDEEWSEVYYNAENTYKVKKYLGQRYHQAKQGLLISIGENNFTQDYWGKNKILKKYLKSKFSKPQHQEPAFKAAEEASLSRDFVKDHPNKKERLSKLAYSMASVKKAQSILTKKHRSILKNSTANDKAKLVVEIFI